VRSELSSIKKYNSFRAGKRMEPVIRAQNIFQLF
jgi:hypothetical protein